jgi:precorrin-6A/cobalt-precorrin-6A reductase
LPPAPPDPVLIVGGSREGHLLADALPGAFLIDGMPDAPAARAVIDASHPCERETHAGVAAICARLGIPLLRYARPGWTQRAGDDWRIVPDPSAARAALSPDWSRVFLCLGRAERTAFAADPTRHYLVRSRSDDPAREGLVAFTLTAKPGPFTATAEATLMRDHRIDALVTRDAGGEGAYPKIEGARRAGLPVILIARPPVACPTAATLEEAAAWLASL